MGWGASVVANFVGEVEKLGDGAERGKEEDAGGGVF